MSQGTLFVKIPEANLKGEKVKLKIEIYNNNQLIETATTNFMGPRSFN
jgi:hypothetical protein